MTTSSNQPRLGCGSQTGLVLLFLTLAGLAAGVLALVAFWMRRLAGPRRGTGR